MGAGFCGYSWTPAMYRGDLVQQKLFISEKKVLLEDLSQLHLQRGALHIIQGVHMLPNSDLGEKIWPSVHM